MPRWVFSNSTDIESAPAGVTETGVGCCDERIFAIRETGSVTGTPAVQFSDDAVNP